MNITTVKGMVGIVSKRRNTLSKRDLTVRFESDELGESLSIADEEVGVMFMIPFGEVSKMIDEARNNGHKNS